MPTTEEQFDQHLEQFSSMPGRRVVVCHKFPNSYSTQIYPCSPSTKHPVGDPDKFHSPERMFKWHCSANKNPGVPCQVRLEFYNYIKGGWELLKKETYEPTTRD